MTRTIAVITITGSFLLAACDSDGAGTSSSGATTPSVVDSSTTSSSPDTTTTDTTDTTATTDTSDTTATTSSSPDTSVVAEPEPLSEEMEKYLDELGSVVMITDACTTAAGDFEVPVLAMRNELIVNASGPEAALGAIASALPDIDQGRIGVEEYQDGQDRVASGVFRARIQDYDPNLADLNILENYNAQNREGSMVSPNYVFSMSQVWRFHPFSPAIPGAAEPSDGGTGGDGRTIAVFDSAFPSNPSVALPATAEGGPLTAYPASAPTEAYPPYGHGPFVADLIQRFAKGATVQAWGLAANVDPAGVFVTITDVQAAMSRAFGESKNADGPDFRESAPDIVNLSLGGPGCELAEPAVFGEFLDRLTSPDEWERGEAPVVVAAAGNSSADIREYPAAYSVSKMFPDLVGRVIAVGSSTDTLGVPDCFSNVGDWVSIWGPGSKQVAAYPYDSGYATWSGTSFATARVSAMLAVGAAQGQPIADYWANLSASVPAEFSLDKIAARPQACP